MADDLAPRKWTQRERRRYVIGIGAVVVAAALQLVLLIMRPADQEAAVWVCATIMVIGFTLAHYGLIGRKASIVMVSISGLLVLVFVSAAIATWR